MALPAPVAMAEPASSQGASGLLASLPVHLPSPCVGGVVLCGDGTIKNPVPCVAGVCVPSACVLPAVLCNGNVIGPLTTPTPTLSPSPSPSSSSPPGDKQPPPGGSTAPGSVAQAPLAAPPGVGIVPPVGPGAPGATSGPAPGSLAALLSRSIGDGLSPGGAHLWPWLAGLQVALLLAVLLVVCSQQLTAAAAPRD